MDEAKFIVPGPEVEATPLYQAGEPADEAYLRTTLLFYGYELGALKNRLEKIKTIQAEYAPQLTTLQEAYASAQMLDNGEAEEIQQEYRQFLQEMQKKIQAVPHD